MDTYKKVITISIIIAVLVLVPLIIYFFFWKKEPPSAATNLSSPAQHAVTPPPTTMVDESTPAEPKIEPLALELNSSDGPIREMLKECSQHKDFGKWILTQDLVRRFVATVDNVSEGKSPAPHLEFLRPVTAFKTLRKGKTIYLDPSGFKRYNHIAEALSSLKIEQTMLLYLKIEPLLESAYKELGYPDKKFGDTLLKALSLLRHTPMPEGGLVLKEKVLVYAFADPKYEGLSEASKHLLRMGPANAEKILGRATEFKLQLKRHLDNRSRQ